MHDPHATPGEAIVSAIEHPSVAGPVEFLERRGWTIHRLGVTPDGVVDVRPLDELLTERTRFVSVMLANNETGVLQPVAEIARRCAALGVPMHTDAVQMIGKLPVDFRALGVSFDDRRARTSFTARSASARWWCDTTCNSSRCLFGGFQQAGLRPGTESVALAVGIARGAGSLAARRPRRAAQRMRALRDRLEAGLAAGYAGQVVVNGCARRAAAAHVESGLRGPRPAGAVDGARSGRRGLFHRLGLRQRLERTVDGAGGHGLRASAVLAGSLRFSLGATTTSAEIDEAIERILARVRENYGREQPRPRDARIRRRRIALLAQRDRL